MQLVGHLTQSIDLREEIIIETGEGRKDSVLDLVYFGDEVVILDELAALGKLKPVVFKINVDINFRLANTRLDALSQLLRSRNELRLVEQ